MLRCLHSYLDKTQVVVTHEVARFLCVAQQSQVCITEFCQARASCVMPPVCRGFSAALPCFFSAAHPGRPAQSNRRKENRCVFCNDAWMAETCLTVGGRRNITRSLKAFRAVYEEHPHIYNAAMMRVPDEWRETFHAASLEERRRPANKPRGAPASSQATAVKEEWQQLLTNRKRAFKKLGSKEVTAYKKRRTADRSRVVKKFFLDNDLPAPEEPTDVAPNDCGTASPVISDRAKFVELWCNLGSWGVCKDCRSLQPRPLEPIDTRRVAKAEITARACKQCRGRQWVPQPSEIPEPLRKLNKKLLEVLRPLEIDVGPYKQAGNGYRIHSAMSRFSWCKDSVRTKIGQVRNRSKRAKVRAAYDYLMTDEAESSYKDFVKKHDKFLRKYPDATDSDRRRPLQFIETVGLECAMWPSLYWRTEMCETTERATDSRRVAAAAVSAGNAALSDDENEEQAEGSGRHSVKRSFMRKVFSPIIGYGHDFELLQFVYDLTMWSRLAGGRTPARDCHCAWS